MNLLDESCITHIQNAQVAGDSEEFGENCFGKIYALVTSPTQGKERRMTDPPSSNPGKRLQEKCLKS